MSTITKEQAKDLRNAFQCWQQDYDPVEDKEQYDMFGLGMVAMDALLASLEAEAVYQFIYNNPYEEGYTEWLDCNKYYFNGVPEDCRRILYTAPSAPVSVPDAYIRDERGRMMLNGKPEPRIGYGGGWNACRAAMLQGKAEPRDSVRCDHAEWSQSTFGSVGPVGPLKHLSKEALEAAAEPGDLSEWADMQFLLWDAQRRAGITDDQITKAMIEKLAVNKARLWPEPKDGEPRLHIKAAPQQEVKP